jgi:hypothetical protein
MAFVAITVLLRLALSFRGIGVDVLRERRSSQEKDEEGRHRERATDPAFMTSPNALVFH